MEFTEFLGYFARIAEYLTNVASAVKSAFTFLPETIISSLIATIGIVVIFRVIK